MRPSRILGRNAYTHPATRVASVRSDAISICAVGLADSRSLPVNPVLSCLDPKELN